MKNNKKGKFKIFYLGLLPFCNLALGFGRVQVSQNNLANAWRSLRAGSIL